MIVNYTPKLEAVQLIVEAQNSVMKSFNAKNLSFVNRPHLFMINVMYEFIILLGIDCIHSYADSPIINSDL